MIMHISIYEEFKKEIMSCSTKWDFDRSGIFTVIQFAQTMYFAFQAYSPRLYNEINAF
jgi:hypothetical protein